MIFIPYSTDAPLYHRPFGTIGLIAANLAAYFLTDGCTSSFAWNQMFLKYGVGLRPVEWVLCNFMHLGLAHLVGNMIFLWIFGLIVEGKLGALRFLGVYLSIGVVGALIEQVGMLGYLGEIAGSCGASLAIFGLMSIALIWAPRNEISFVGFYAFFRILHTFEFDIAVMYVALWYVGWDLFSASLVKFAVGTATLHLLGAVIGAGVGWLFLKRGWVDCEGWDIVNVWKGKPEAAGYLPARRKVMETASGYRDLGDDEPPLESEAERKTKQSLLKRLRAQLDRGEFVAALDTRRKLALLKGADRLQRDDLHRLIGGLLSLQQWEPTIPLLEEFLLRFPEKSARHCLKLCELYLDKLRRPGEAKRLLDELPEAGLSPEERTHRRRLESRVRQLLEAGVYEIG